MKTRIRTEMLIETHETIIVRQAKRFPLAWCAACGALTLQLTPDQAATIAQTSVREIHEKLDAGLVHTVKTDNGKIFICSSAKR